MSIISADDFTRPTLEPFLRLLTAADLTALPDDLPTGPVKYELDNGRLIMTPVPGRPHGKCQARMATALHVRGEAKGHGEVLTESGVILWRNPDRVIGPDVAFIAKASMPVRESPEGFLETMPDLIVEVRSKNDTLPFLERKAADYLKAGVKLVWLVDPKRKTVTAHRPDAEVKSYDVSGTLTCDDIIPGFSLTLAELFKE
jgi:Uma2 family endonuclease